MTKWVRSFYEKGSYTTKDKEEANRIVNLLIKQGVAYTYIENKQGYYIYRR